MEDAEQELKRAMELDPTLYEAPYYYGRILQMQGQLAEAAAYFERAASLREDDFQAAGLANTIYRGLGRNEDMTRTGKRCVDAAKRAIAVNPGDSRALQLGALALQNIGEIATSKEWAERAIEVDPNEISTLYNVACLFSVTGEPEKALDLLERAVDLGWSRPEWLRQDLDLVPLREHPRYLQLVARLESASG
jgi:adenylate cyclase